jgi:hypothetical protein
MVKRLEKRRTRHQKKKRIKTNTSSQVKVEIIRDYKNKSNNNERTKILRSINSMLLKLDQLSIPSQFSSDYINTIT